MRKLTGRHVEALALLFKKGRSSTIPEAIDDFAGLLAAMMFYRSAPELWDSIIDGAIALGVPDRSSDLDQQNAATRETLDLIDLTLEKEVDDGS